MRIKILLTIFFTLISHVAFSASTVEELIQIPTYLNKTIIDLDFLLEKNIPNLDNKELEVLKWGLIDIKNNLVNLEKKTAISDALALAENHKWNSVTNVLLKIEEICSNIEKMGNECSTKINEFDNFLGLLTLSASDKSILKEFVNEYSTFIKAKLIINDNFVKTLNTSLIKFDSLINVPGKPLASIKLSAPILKELPTIKKELFLVHKKENSLFTQLMETNKIIKTSVFVFLLLLIFSVSRKLYLKRLKLKKINNFYQVILYGNHKNKIKTKIFGRVGVNDFKKFNHVRSTYVELVELLGPLKSAMDIKFKKNNKTFIIETLLHTSIPLQQYLSSENHNLLSLVVNRLNEVTSQVAGKVLITNSFDQSGYLVNSKIIITL